MTGQSVSLFSPNVYTYLWDTQVDRSTIRNQIVTSFSNQLTDAEKNNILDLNQLPKSKNLFFSISHSPVGSGFVAYNKPIGFDIEKTKRTQKQSLINRISTAKEQKLLGDKYFLIWNLKEAAFKRLSQEFVNLKTVSEIYIEQVDTNGTQELKAHLVYNNIKVLGLCKWSNGQTFCVAL
ncbi:MAG: 4'-phosphopantetheinyl transferase superfamily protein [Bdellovibrionales bacterium]|nr:4'-phosphopantetheinyl transferase superfamily protein [Bdellovibrionales bacterium]